MPQADAIHTLHFAYPHAEKPDDALIQAANALNFIGAAVQCEETLASAQGRAGVAMLLAAAEHTIRQVSALLPGP